MQRQDELRQALRAALASEKPTDLGEAQAIADRVQTTFNDAPLEDFDGLSPAQMTAFLYYPFDTPELVSFATAPPPLATAPILDLYGRLADAIGAGGLRATAKGNLPRNLVREAAFAYYPPDADIERHVYREEDFPILYGVRKVAEMTGLVRKRHGKFFFTRAARNLHAEGGAAAAYPALFRAFALEFNWGVWDAYEDMPIIQQAFLFSLRLLARFGDEPRPATFYADAFLRAFPSVVDQVMEQTWTTREEQVKRCYALRTFRVLRLFGLAEREDGRGAHLVTRDEGRWRKSPLLDAWVTFRV